MAPASSYAALKMKLEWLISILFEYAKFNAPAIKRALF
jgi:hypothetical protein